jgi:hypothetical protein
LFEWPSSKTPAIRTESVYELMPTLASAREGEAVAARADQRQGDSQLGEERGRGRARGQDGAVGFDRPGCRQDADASIRGRQAFHVDVLPHLDPAGGQVRREPVEKAFGANVAVDEGVHTAGEPFRRERGLELFRLFGP